MSFNENFVVRNGLEVANSLIYADYITNKVGIGTTTLIQTLTVYGGIGGQNITISGISTVAQLLAVGLAGTVLTASSSSGFVGIGTANPQYKVEIQSPISTGQTALYVKGDTFITGDLQATNITFDQANVSNLNVSGVATIATGTFTDGLYSTGITSVSNLNVVGVTTSTSINSTDINISGIASIAVGIVSDLTVTNLNVTGITTTNDLEVSGAATVGFITASDVYVSGASTFVGVGTFISNLYVGGGFQVSSTSTFLNVVDFNGYLVTFGQSSSDEVTFNSKIASNLIPRLDDTYDIGTSNSRWRTVNAGFGTFQNLYSSGITTTDSLSIGSTQVISNSRELQNIVSLDAVTTATIESAISNAPNTFSDIVVTGISTFIGIATFANGIEVTSGVSTFNSLVNIANDLIVTGIATISSLDVVGAAISNLAVSGISTLGVTSISQLNVSGISTLGTVRISSGIITATSGIVTYYGDGQYLDLTNNPSTGIGIGTTGGLVGYGITFIDFYGAGVSTAFYDSSVGIATIFFEGGGGGGTIGIGTEFPLSAANGDLFFSAEFGRLFVYYDEDIIGVGTDAFWIDAAPFNQGVITSLTNVSFVPGSASNPSIFFVGDSQTGFFSPTLGQVTIVSSGSSILNINPSGISVTGIVTAQDFDSLSDINYKENVNTINGALIKVEQLRGVKFDWKESGSPSYGVIAQELEEVLPELVHGENPKTVNYNGIIGVLIEAIKELKAEVEELKNTK